MGNASPSPHYTHLDRPLGDYGTIQRPSRSMPSLLPDPQFVNQFFNFPPPPKHFPLPQHSRQLVTDRTRRLSMPGKLGTLANSSITGAKKDRKARISQKKPKGNKLKKKIKFQKQIPLAEPTFSNQPDCKDGSGGVDAFGSREGNLSDDEREDDGGEDSKKGKDYEYEYEDLDGSTDEAKDVSDENDVSHEADVEDLFEENSLPFEVFPVVHLGLKKTFDYLFFLLYLLMLFI